MPGSTPSTPLAPQRRRQLGRRRRRVEAAVARALVGHEGRELAVEAEDRRRDDRVAQAHRGVVEQVARREVVDAVDDHVVVLDDLDDVVEASRRVWYLTTLTSGLSASIALRADSTFGIADAVGGVDHLALEVGEVDDVVVDDAERADAGGGEVERGRRAEAAGAEQQHLRVEQLQLALEADLGEQQVARVALALLRR